MKIFGYALILALILSAFTGTYKAGQHFERQKWEAAEAEALALIRKQNAQLQQTINELEIASAEQQLLIDAERAKSKQLGETLNESQRNDSECNLLRGTIVMLNEARGYPAGVSNNQKLSAEESKTASTITEQRLIEENHGCELDYRSLMVEHNTLVDAVSEINKKLARIKSSQPTGSHK